MQHSTVNLGLGLIGIGRTWGYRPSAIPDESGVEEFLTAAMSLGIQFFDTAPSYGNSEVRLGKFLRTLELHEYQDLTIATKVGEHWDSDLGKSYTDHSYDALCSSIERSLSSLGRIDLLQVHKASPAVLFSHDLRRALEWARQIGVRQFGVSVSDLPTGTLACADARFSFIQFPYNTCSPGLVGLISEATKAKKVVLINRPFNMGQQVVDNGPKLDAAIVRRQCYDFILRQAFRGFILTGTASKAHLKENSRAFLEAAVDRGICTERFDLRILPDPVF